MDVSISERGNILKEEDFRDWFPERCGISRKWNIILDVEGIEKEGYTTILRCFDGRATKFFPALSLPFSRFAKFFFVKHLEQTIRIGKTFSQSGGSDIFIRKW